MASEDHPYKDQRVTVMGLGLFGGGAGAVRYLAERGARVTVTDLKPAGDLAPSIHELMHLPVTYVLGRHREEDFTDADMVVVNPAVKPDNPLVRLARHSGARVTYEINLFFGIARERELPVIGVTGTAGKSTTTALLGEMIRAAHPKALVGGNIGGSLLDAAEAAAPGTPCVVELSSFQLHSLVHEKLSPEVAVVTNLAPNHMDWHGSFKSYERDKRSILRFQDETGTAVLNHDDERVRSWRKKVHGAIVYTSMRGAPDSAAAACVYFADGGFMVRDESGERRVADRDDLRLPGDHNAANVLSALGGALMFEGALESARESMRAFGGLPHRLEFVGEANGVRFYNDSKATTPEAAILALKSFVEPVTIIAGGYDKGVSLQDLGREIAACARRAVCLGDTGPRIHDDIRLCREAGAGRCESVMAPGLDSAVKKAASGALPGEVVLLSPGCASWGMFKNYEDRGERFRALVHRMAQKADE